MYVKTKLTDWKNVVTLEFYFVLEMHVIMQK